MTSEALGKLPDRLQNALDKADKMQQAGIVFAPVRHHSPACAFAVREQIRQFAPTHVLIEAPASFAALLPDLLHPDTVPPVAILTQTEYTITRHDDTDEGEEDSSETEKITASAFYPFCEYSPEWQAIQMAQTVGADISFIDSTWSAQRQQEEQQQDPQNLATSSRGNSLQNERYLAHSQYIQALADKLHCRNHDDVWEHLFELRPLSELGDWRHFFQDTLVWSSMARLDYETDVLAQEGSSQREEHMLLAMKRAYHSQKDVRLLVVTGAFHTLALIEQWQDTAPTAKEEKQWLTWRKQDTQNSSWLIRYSFDRLDALNGYASGMPAPRFYQKRWQAMLNSPSPQTSAYLTDMAWPFVSDVILQLRQKFTDAPLGFTALKNSIEQAQGLATLRSHHGPSRYDLLDGLQTGLVKGSINDVQDSLWAAIQQSFSGYQLGSIPLNTRTPPLLQSVYQQAEKFRFKLDDTLSKNTALDIYRKTHHREKSAFLQQLSFLDVGFANKLDGPDFVHGLRLELLFEDWQYAWTPIVEARLIDLSEEGQSLSALIIKKLRQSEADLSTQGQGQSASAAVKMLLQAAVMGMQDILPFLMVRLSHYVDTDNQLSSLVDCAHRLLHVWRSQVFLGLEDNHALPLLLDSVATQSLFYLEQIVDAKEANQHLATLLSMREWFQLAPEAKLERKHDFYAQLNRISPQLTDNPLLMGAVDAMRYLDDYWDEAALKTKILQIFGLGADSENAIQYLLGMMQTAPELMTQLPFLLNILDELIASWDEETFIAVLPDLRFALSQLTPKENHALAEQLATRYQTADQALEHYSWQYQESDMLQAVALNARLQKQLSNHALDSWLSPSKKGNA